jgi:Nuf2 family
MRIGILDEVFTTPNSIVQDLTKPEEPRLRRQLSALVNFARFRETKLEVYLAWQQDTDALL